MLKGEGGGHEIRDKLLRKFCGEEKSGLTRYVTGSYKFSTIISQKLRCIFNIFLESSVKIFLTKRIQKFLSKAPI